MVINSLYFSICLISATHVSTACSQRYYCFWLQKGTQYKFFEQKGSVRHKRLIEITEGKASEIPGSFTLLEDPSTLIPRQ
jgi:hypothetical protein